MILSNYITIMKKEKDGASVETPSITYYFTKAKNVSFLLLSMRQVVKQAQIQREKREQLQ